MVRVAGNGKLVGQFAGTGLELVELGLNISGQFSGFYLGAQTLQLATQINHLRVTGVLGASQGCVNGGENLATDGIKTDNLAHCAIDGIRKTGCTIR